MRLARALVALAAAAAGALASAAAPSTAPQLRVVQEMHNAPLGQIRSDAAHTRLYTLAQDKTLRIWRLADLQLLRTVYLPAEAGLEGTPYGLAVSRDGKHAYVAGVTGWQWSRAAHVYVVDAERGQIAAKLGRFDNDVVIALDLSPDGKRLAVGLARGGLQVLDAQSGAVLAADPAYAAPVSFLHHGPDGRLASTSEDGCVRVYGRDMALAFRGQYPPVPAGQPQCTGSQLGGIRFSPDGRWLAFGVRYQADGGRQQPEVTVMDAASLAVRRTLRPDAADQQSLCCVAWSPDSATLYVSGNVDGSGPTPIYRVQDLRSGALERWNVGRQQITNMLPLPQGQIVLATTVPSITRVGADGQVVIDREGVPQQRLPHNIDFHATGADPSALRVSADGQSLALARGDASRLRVNLSAQNQLSVLTTEGLDDAALQPARRTGAVKVDTATGIYGYRQPTQVNGRPVALEREESVWSWALHATQPIAALGTQWRLRLVDAQGKPMKNWETPPYLGSPAFHTLITADGRKVVVALGDGTLRWFAVDSGRELLGLFVHNNGSDWVAWRADGYYASSPQGDQYVGWLVNRGDDRSPDFHRAVQFERRLYRPDLVRAALRPATLSALASAEALAETLRQMAAPRVSIEAITPGTEPGTVAVRLSAESTGQPIQELGLYVDGVPVLRPAERRVAPGDAQRLVRTVTARLNGAGSVIRAEAETERSLGIDESAPLAAPPASRARPGRLWLVLTGVSRFDSVLACEARGDCKVRVTQLPNTTRDARELAAVLTRHTGKLFSSVSTVLLAEDAPEQPTKANLVSRLKELEQVSPDDTVLVFVASHGFTPDPASGEYYFLTKDSTQQDLLAVTTARPGQPLDVRAAASLMSGTELHALLRRVPGKRILVLDTCHSGSADGRSDPYALAKRSASAQIAVLSASQGDQLSYEIPPDPSGNTPQHGAFTYALIEALSGRAAAPGAPVTLQSAFRYVGPRVNDLLKRVPKGASQRALQTPTLSANPALAATALAAP
ncbi:caspase family protein [Piscinibacter sp. HJYY11]|uniref:caspase family protein n=1 Tax=Piscinibacter sp. HJYY11 TaxID=2801333 RepID=UPI00191F54B2|nr:caspase family protein [Piscinibacter sp. HJYY11]MBL0730977.1 caspase family protein [Piscinibacter sp. HJYY11]